MAKIWREVPQFQPRTRKYYEKKQGLEEKETAVIEPARFKDPKENTNAMGRIVNHRQRLSHLIQCLAISETQKNQLVNQVDAVTRQKQELDVKLNNAIKDKQDILERHQSSESALDESRRELEAKIKLVQDLQAKIVIMQEQLEAEKAAKSVNNESLAHSPVLESSTLNGVGLLEERLKEIHTEIHVLNLKIANQEKGKETNSTQPATNAISIPTADETSSLSVPSSAVDTTSKNQTSMAEDVPSLEVLLKKLLKRKVHYQAAQDKSEDTTTIKKPLSSIQILEMELEKARQDQLKNKKSSKTTIADESRTRNAATSPPNESYMIFSAKNKFPKKKEKTKKVQHQSSSSCACATCSSNVSWICPDCYHTQDSTMKSRNISFHHTIPSTTNGPISSSIKESFLDKTNVLFANDTSMIRPLADIVSEMDDEIPSKPSNISPTKNYQSFAIGRDINVEEEELIEVISSLNGI